MTVLAVPDLRSVLGLRGHESVMELERDYRRTHFAPPPALSISEWADRFRFLSREASAVPGRWRTLPFQKPILDAIRSGKYRRIVAVLPSQVGGKTEILLNTVGYHADLDPCPMLFVEPTIEMARGLSRDRLAPMFRDTPRLRGKLNQFGPKDSDNTILHKAGPGWRITLVGANSPSGLSMRPIRIVLFDEPDRYPPSAGEEGSVLSLGIARTTSYQEYAIIVITGSPTIKGASIIEREFNLSDQQEWMVPCPHCGHVQALEFGGADEPYGLKWEKGKPETAAYLCAGCSVLIEEHHKDWMNERGDYVAQFPGRDIGGFHFTALASPLMRWPALAKEWYEAQKDDEKLKAFFNTRLGRTWEIPGESLEASSLAGRRMALPDGADIPDWAGVLTLSCDVQGDRLEVALWAWGAGEQVFCRSYTLRGDTSDPKGEPYQQLDLLRTKFWRRPDGAVLQVKATTIDTGDQTATVSDYVRPRQPHGVYGTKGSNIPNKPIIAAKPGRSDKHRIRVWMLGTDSAKDVLFNRLRRNTKVGPGHISFAADVSEYFLEQFGGERLVYRRIHGMPSRAYEPVPGKENHSIDLWVMGYGALWILGAVVRDHIGAYAASAKPAPVEPEKPFAQPEPEVDAFATPRRAPSSGFSGYKVGRW